MSASGTLPADWLSDTVSQPDSRAAGGVWDCPSAACCSVAPQSPRATGRRRERTHDSHPAFIPLPLRRTGRTGSQDRFRGSADRHIRRRRMPAYWRRGRDRTRDGHCDCGRHQRWPRFSEWKAVCCLGGGLVPRQHSSGGKTKLLGISKRGDPYLRALLVHGARSVVYRAKAKTDCRSRWINDKQQRLGTARACIALANKNARILWSLIAKQQVYRPAVCS